MANPIDTGELMKEAQKGPEAVAAFIRGPETLHRQERVARAREALGKLQKELPLPESERKTVIEGSRMVIQDALDTVVTDLRTEAGGKLEILKQEKEETLKAREEALVEQRKLAGPVESFVNEGLEIGRDFRNADRSTQILQGSWYATAAGVAGVAAYKAAGKVVDGVKWLWDHSAGWVLKKVAGVVGLRGAVETAENAVAKAAKWTAGAAGAVFAPLLLRKGWRKAASIPGDVKAAAEDSLARNWNTKVDEFTPKWLPAGATSWMKLPTSTPGSQPGGSDKPDAEKPPNGQKKDKNTENPETRDWGEVVWDTLKKGGGLLYESGKVSLFLEGKTVELQGEALWAAEQYLTSNKQSVGDLLLVWTEAGASYLMSRNALNLLLYGKNPLPKSIGSALWSLSKVTVGPLTAAKDTLKYGSRMFTAGGRQALRINFVSEAVPMRILNYLGRGTLHYTGLDVGSEKGVLGVGGLLKRIENLRRIESDIANMNQNSSGFRKIFEGEGDKHLKRLGLLRDEETKILRTGVQNIPDAKITDPRLLELKKGSALPDVSFRAEVEKIWKAAEINERATRVVTSTTAETVASEAALPKPKTAKSKPVSTEPSAAEPKQSAKPPKVRPEKHPTKKSPGRSAQFENEGGPLRVRNPQPKASPETFPRIYNPDAEAGAPKTPVVASKIGPRTKAPAEAVKNIKPEAPPATPATPAASRPAPNVVKTSPMTGSPDALRAASLEAKLKGATPKAIPAKVPEVVARAVPKPPPVSITVPNALGVAGVQEAVNVNAAKANVAPQTPKQTEIGTVKSKPTVPTAQKFPQPIGLTNPDALRAAGVEAQMRILEEIGAARRTGDLTKVGTLISENRATLQAAEQAGNKGAATMLRALTATERWATLAKVGKANAIPIIGTVFDAFLIAANESAIAAAEKGGAPADVIYDMKSQRTPLAVSGVGGAAITAMTGAAATDTALGATLSSAPATLGTAMAPALLSGIVLTAPVVGASFYKQAIDDSVAKWKKTEKDYLQKDPATLRADIEREITNRDAGTAAANGDSLVSATAWKAVGVVNPAAREKHYQEKFEETERRTNKAMREKMYKAYFMHYTRAPWTEADNAAVLEREKEALKTQPPGATVDQKKLRTETVQGIAMQRFQEAVSDKEKFIELHSTHGGLEVVPPRELQKADDYAELRAVYTQCVVANQPPVLRYQTGDGQTRTLDLSVLSFEGSPPPEKREAIEKVLKQYHDEVKISEQFRERSLAVVKGEEKAKAKELLRADLLAELRHHMIRAEENLRKYQRRTNDLKGKVVRAQLLSEFDGLLSELTRKFEKTDLSMEEYRSSIARMQTLCEEAGNADAIFDRSKLLLKQFDMVPSADDFAEFASYEKAEREIDQYRGNFLRLLETKAA